jgi:hypothetical protein
VKELPNERSLPYPRWPLDDHQARSAVMDVLQLAEQLSELGLPADERSQEWLIRQIGRRGIVW